MKRLDLGNASDDELVECFAMTAKQMGASALDSEVRKTNRMYHLMRFIDSELRARGQEARLKLMPLLDDRDRFVRYYAAQKLLGVVPDRARAILEWNAKHKFDSIAGDAGMLLDAVEKGIYKPD